VRRRRDSGDPGDATTERVCGCRGAYCCVLVAHPRPVLRLACRRAASLQPCPHLGRGRATIVLSLPCKALDNDGSSTKPSLCHSSQRVALRGCRPHTMWSTARAPPAGPLPPRRRAAAGALSRALAAPAYPTLPYPTPLHPTRRR